MLLNQLLRKSFAFYIEDSAASRRDTIYLSFCVIAQGFFVDLELVERILYTSFGISL